MIDLVTTSFCIMAPHFEKEDFERYSTKLFEEWERHVEQNLDLTDYSLTLVVEEGSIKGKGKIAASLAVVYFAIGSYGDFISGLNAIADQVNYVSKALFDQSKTTFGCNSASGNTRRTGGAITHLKNLFDRVQRGQITSEEAIKDVELRLGDEAISVPGFLQDLEASLIKAPKRPERLTLGVTPERLDLVNVAQADCQTIPLQEKRIPHKPPRPLPIPISQHYRIEISRDSKNDKKKIKNTKVK